MRRVGSREPPQLNGRSVWVSFVSIHEPGVNQVAETKILEATIGDIHGAYRSGELTCRQLVQMYLDRIAGFDKQGPAINAIITINGKALEEADRLDESYKRSGPVGALHGIPVIVKDQADVKGMPTTLGSVLFKDYYPDRDSFVVERLKKAGALILAKDGPIETPKASKRLDIGIAMLHAELAAEAHGVTGRWTDLSGADVARFDPVGAE